VIAHPCGWPLDKFPFDTLSSSFCHAIFLSAFLLSVKGVGSPVAGLADCTH